MLLQSVFPATLRLVDLSGWLTRGSADVAQASGIGLRPGESNLLDLLLKAAANHVRFCSAPLQEFLRSRLIRGNATFVQVWTQPLELDVQGAQAERA